MAQHVLLPDTDIKLGASWTSSWPGASAWSVLESPRFAHLSSTAQGTGGGANEARVGFTTFALAAGETVTDVVVNVYAALPAGKTITFNLANNAGAIGGTNVVGSGAALPLGTGSSHTFSGFSSFNQANIDSLTVGFFPGNENTSQVELHAVHINIRTTGGPKLAYDPLASKRFRTNNDGAEFQDPNNPGYSLTSGPQGGDSEDTVRLPTVGGIPRTLWILGDSTWTDGPGIFRDGDSDLPHNPVCHSLFGIQYGTDLTNPLTTIDWYPGVEDETGAGQFVGAFMPPVMINGTPYYRWAQAGLNLDDEVLLIAGATVQTSTAGAAEVIGGFMSRYTNITDTPDNWVEELVDWRAEQLWGIQVDAGFGGLGRPGAMGLSDVGDGYVYGVYGLGFGIDNAAPGTSGTKDVWGVLRFSRVEAKTSGAAIRPEYWDGQQWLPDQQFSLSNNRSWMRRRRALNLDIAEIKRWDEPTGSMLFTFGSVYKRPVDGQWMLTGMDIIGSSCWYAIKPTITGPFTPLINAGPANSSIYGGGYTYGGLQHWTQAWPGRGNDDVLISHTGNGPHTKIISNWPGMYRLTGT